MCLKNDGIKDSEQFLLKRHAYDNQRRDLLGAINEVVQFIAAQTCQIKPLCTLYDLVITDLPIIKIDKF